MQDYYGALRLEIVGRDGTDTCFHLPVRVVTTGGL